MPKRGLISVFVFGMVLIGSSVSALAAPILMVRNFGARGDNQNDCSGTFGNPGGQNSPCDVGRPLGADVSPWIAKFDTETDAWEVNSSFSGITGAEFTINGAANGNGTWSYTPGVDDPAVRYWVGKGGNAGFRLHWMVESTTVGNTCDGDPYNLACLNLALAVTSGDWATPTQQGLSHITFYDSGRDVPEPVTLGLFGAGALAAGFARRRRNR